MELAAVVHALKIWCHYLLSNTCHIHTNHKSSKYIFTQAKLNIGQIRWLELIKNCSICSLVWHLLESESFTPKVSWRTRTITHSKLEAGRYWNRLHNRSTQDVKRFWLNLGHCRSPYKISSFIPIKTDNRAPIYDQLYVDRIMSLHGIHDNCLRYGYTVYLLILETTTQILRYQTF